MDTYIDQLFELAGIAITLTGFSALISVVGTSKSTSDKMVDKFRVLLLIVCGLATVTNMLLPVILANFLDDVLVWRYASVSAFAITFSLGLWSFSWTRHHHGVFTTLDKIVTVIVYSLCVVFLGVLTAIVLRETGQYAGALYLLAMFLATLILGMFLSALGRRSCYPAFTVMIVKQVIGAIRVFTQSLELAVAHFGVFDPTPAHRSGRPLP